MKFEMMRFDLKSEVSPIVVQVNSIFLFFFAPQKSENLGSHYWMTFPTMKHLGPCESEVLLKKDESIFDGDASELLGGPKEMMVQSCVKLR